MVAQRGSGLGGRLAAPVEPAGMRDRGPLERPAPRRKLGFNERRALEMLPLRIDELRANLDALERKLADPDFAGREPAGFFESTRRFAELRDALADAEDEWLGLEILREELERQ
jgi:ATP-binding cassette subfamily F protein uup